MKIVYLYTRMQKTPYSVRNNMAETRDGINNANSENSAATAQRVANICTLLTREKKEGA